jgi:NAD(P)-dependent dehydrogenase (short-subunit alcohol dehydrogenase family)
MGEVREFGRIDVLINNAGIAKAQPFLEITHETWEAHLRIHLFGAFYCSRAAAPRWPSASTDGSFRSSRWRAS